MTSRLSSKTIVERAIARRKRKAKWTARDEFAVIFRTRLPLPSVKSAILAKHAGEPGEAQTEKDAKSCK